MLFSPPIMARFTTRVIKQSPTSAPVSYFSLSGSVFSVMESINAIRRDDSKAAAGVRNHRDADMLAGWCGLRGQTLESVFESGSITAAIEDFQKAKARIDAQLTRGKLNYSPVGGSFNTGRFLTGHPVCMYNREKTKLPPKNINLVIRCSANLEPDKLSAPLVKIIRAAWEYQAAGGLVTLTVNYFHTFSRAQEWEGVKHKGLIVTVNIPLSNPGILATAASVQFYRAVSMPVACYLSGEWADGLPVEYWTGPGLFGLDGRSGDAAVLKELAVA